MQSFLCTSARARRHSWSRPPCSRRPPASYPRCYAPYPNSLQPLPPKTSSLMTPHFFQKNLLTTGGESTPTASGFRRRLRAGLAPLAQGAGDSLGTLLVRELRLPRFAPGRIPVAGDVFGRVRNPFVDDVFGPQPQSLVVDPGITRDTQSGEIVNQK